MKKNLISALLLIILFCITTVFGQNSNLLQTLDSIFNEAEKLKDPLRRIDCYKNILKLSVSINNNEIPFSTTTKTIDLYKNDIELLVDRNKKDKYSSEISYYYGITNYIKTIHDHKPNKRELEKSLELARNEWFLYFTYMSLAYLEKNINAKNAQRYYETAIEHLKLYCVNSKQDDFYYFVYFNSLYKLVYITDRLKQFSNNIIYCDSMISLISSANYSYEFMFIPFLYKAVSYINLNRINDAYQMFMENIKPIVEANTDASKYLLSVEFVKYTEAYSDLLYCLCESKSNMFCETAVDFCQNVADIYKKNRRDLTAYWLWRKATFYKLQTNDSMALETLDSALIYDDYSGTTLCLYKDIGEYYKDSTYYIKGINALKKALKNFERENIPENIAMVYRNISTLFLANQKCDSAFYYLQRVPIISNFDSINYLENAADIYVEMNRFDDALISIQKALCLYSEEHCTGSDFLLLDKYNHNADYFNQRDYYLFSELLKKGDVLFKAYESTGDKKYLLPFYRTSFLITKDFQGFFNVFGNKYKSEDDWFEFSSRYYSNVDYMLCHFNGVADIYNADTLFYLSEKTRTYYFRTIYNKAQAIETMNDSLQREYTHHQTLLAEYQSAGNTKGFMSENRKLDDFFSNLKSLYPEIYYTFFSSDVYSAAVIGNGLQNNQIMLEYFVGDSTLTTFCIRRDTCIMHQTHLTKNRLDSLIAMLLYHVSAVNQDDDIVANHYGFELYKILLSPFENYISDSSSLIIIPDGRLFELPFETLLTGPPQKNNNQPYLILRNPVSYHYSATLWHNTRERYLQKNRNNNQYAFLGFAPFGNQIEDDDSKALRESCSTADLNHSDDEVRSIFRIFSSKDSSAYNISENASELLFKKHCAKYQYIDLALHGCTDNSSNPYLVFFEQKNNNSNTSDDGKLELQEIFDLYPMKTDLLTLTACQSGLGKNIPGEGMISLTRAFLYAGASNITYTLFEIYDNDAKDIMTGFYSEISEQNNDVSYSKALQQAKIKKIKESKFMVNWCPVVLLGVN